MSFLRGFLGFFGYGGGVSNAETRAAAECAPKSPLTDITPVGLAGLLQATPLTDSATLSVSPAWSAIRYISEAIAALPLEVFKRTPKGNFIAEDHPVYALFSGSVHPHYSNFDFISALIANACLGNGYARIHWDADMRPVYLEHIPRNLVQQEYLPDGSLIYRITGNAANSQSFTTTVMDWEMIHIKGLSLTGMNGIPVQIIHNEGLSTAIAAKSFSNKFFQNGAHISGLVKTQHKASIDDLAKISRYFDKNYAGSSNVGKTAVLDNGMDYVKIGLNPSEAAVLDFSKLSAIEVSQIFKIPLHLLSQLERSTFTNMEQQSSDFVMHTVSPWLRKIEQEFNRKLFSTVEIRKRKYFTAFNANALLKADKEALSKFYASAVQNGYMTPNEVRQEIGLNPAEGGDRLLVQMNLTTLEKAGTEPPAPAKSDKKKSPDMAPDSTAPAQESKSEQRDLQPQIERRHLFATAEMRAMDNEKRTIAGYAACYNTIADLGYYTESIQPGAFANTNMDNVFCLFNHDPSQVLGRNKSGTLRITTDEKGLYYECDLPDTSKGKEVYELIRRGDISQCSFGFTVMTGTSKWEGDHRTITAIETLFDVSPVTFPAYADTSVAKRESQEYKRTAYKPLNNLGNHMALADAILAEYAN